MLLVEANALKAPSKEFCFSLSRYCVLFSVILLLQNWKQKKTKSNHESGGFSGAT